MNHVTHFLSRSAQAFIASRSPGATITILDSGASVNIFSDTAGLFNIRKGEPIHIKGVTDRAVLCGTVGTHPVFGDVYISDSVNMGVNIPSVPVMRTLFLFELDAAATRFHLTPKSDPTRRTATPECMCTARAVCPVSSSRRL
jgi:hypothetical protein